VSDDYLWNRSGRDEDVERLEQLLEPLALQSDVPRPRAGNPGRLAIVAAAAALLVAILASVLRPVEPSALPERIDFPDVGHVRTEPGARGRVIRQSPEQVRLRLDRGTIHASIGAHVKPRLFQVETPVTTCVDLGCIYTLTVDAEGRSVVSVTLGRVAFVDGAREVYIPTGASCRASRRGSGTPAYDGAAPEFIAAVHAFDDAPSVERARRVASLARKEDRLTLWHFLQDAAVVEVGCDALVRLWELPPDVTREATLRRDPDALAAWKRHLGYTW